MDLNNKKELKRVWVEALRSGEYTQCTGTLHHLNSGGSCCLGVAAKVWGIATFDEMGAHSSDEDLGEDEGPTEIYDLLDNTVGKQRRERMDGTVYYARHKALEDGITMNDNGKSFAEIADMIEREWNV